MGGVVPQTRTEVPTSFPLPLPPLPPHSQDREALPPHGQYGLPSSVDSSPLSHSSPSLDRGTLPSPFPLPLARTDTLPPPSPTRTGTLPPLPSSPLPASTGPGHVGGIPLAFMQEDCLVILTNYFKSSLKTFLSEMYWQ